MTIPTIQWNIFARELDTILRAHGSWIGQLDNNEIALHPQQVQRLYRSLSTPKPLVMLNPEVLTRIIHMYSMSSHEQWRLKAAILATAIERILMDRIEASLALMISNNAFETLFAAFEADPSLPELIRQSNFITQVGDTEEGELAHALDLLDQGFINLHLILQTTSPVQQQQEAKQALQSFRFILDILEHCSIEEQRSAEWQYWHQEAQHSYSQVQSLAEGKY